MKKNILRIAVGLIFISALSIRSCDFLENCGTCEYIVEIDGVVSEEESSLATPFCGEDLAERQNSDPDVLGNKTSYWNCY